MAAAPGVSDAELAELIGLWDQATDAYISGAARRYFSLFEHGADYTLMPPYGGPTVHGFEPSEEGIEETSRFFASGSGRFELQASYTSGDLVVLVGIERQHGEVGGRPDQDWSLRISLVFRRTDAGWELVHRHADALVREIPFDHLAVLARGGLED
jgi:ketosteroid isomerase-like protein